MVKMSGELREHNRRDKDEATNVDLTETSDEPPRKKTNRKSFDDYFQDLVAYKQKHGNCTSLCSEDPSLYNWVKKVREGRIQLTDDQRDRLDGVGLGETRIERNDRLWNEQFEKLKAYKEHHGQWSIASLCKDHPQLGRWAALQRQAYKTETFREERKGQLESIGFVWQIKVKKPYDATKGDKKWVQQYEKLVEFKQTHGHCLVPIKYPKDKSLAVWASNQRACYANTTIRQDRKEVLDKLGFGSIASTSDRKWSELYEKLVEFKQAHGDCMVPKDYEKDKTLATWASYQRTSYANNRMRQDRKKLLDKLGFIWKIYISCAAASSKPAHSESVSLQSVQSEEP
jgi:hypothetical protein